MATQAEQKQVEQFLSLMEEDISHLKNLLKSIGAQEIPEKKSDVVRELVRMGYNHSALAAPQALAIRTTDDEKAQEFVRNANAKILPQRKDGTVNKKKMKVADFTFTTQDGEQYTVQCPYIKLSKSSARKLVKNNWLSPLKSQEALLAKMKEAVDQDNLEGRFNLNLIRKRDSGSQWYLMVHIEPLLESDQEAA